MDYIERLQKVEGAGLKYIHSIEAYVTDDEADSEEKTRDNYHLLLIAKNFEGVKEINKLSSNSFNRNDNHYHYKPRMFFSEIASTTDNVIILTSCLSSPLWRTHNSGNTDSFNKWLSFFVANKHRVYLEVQPHLDEDQMKFNKILLGIAKKHEMNIVATNDAHASTAEHDALRKIIKKGKKLDYEDEDKFELWAKTREEMANSFREQGVLSEKEINSALDNTIVIADSTERIELDKSYKYPKMFDKEKQEVGMTNVSYLRDKPFNSSLDVFKQLIVDGYNSRGINKLPLEKQKEYKERVNAELNTYIKTGSVDYMLLEWSLKKEAREKKVNPERAIYPAYGRGSVSGSLVAFLLYVTEMDAVKEELNFARFMSEFRISLADIDSDYSSVDRYSIMGYLLRHEKLNCASIATKNTYGIKNAIKAVGRGLGYTVSELEKFSAMIDNNEGEIPVNMKDNHEDLCKMAEMAVGATDSFGRHASGIVVSDLDIDEILGTMTLPKWDYKVTQNCMSSIDSLNFVKLDILGLDNTQLIEESGNMAGLERLTPNSEVIDFEDKDVWRSAREDNVGIFQFESDRAGKILKEILSDETMNKIRAFAPSITYMDVLNIANAAQRPSSSSFLEDLTHGIARDNGSEALNEFLASSMGYLLYQEQITGFLVKFCGYAEGHADVIRRAIGKKKKEVIDEEVPKIKEAFISTMVSEYGDKEEHAKKLADDFMQVIIDSSSYGFSLNHSKSYSYISYISLWLREKYPLEFTASALDIWQKTDKEKRFIQYAEEHGISINPPRFRKSKGGYFVDKENNAIYQGTSHIKGGNGAVGDTLYEIRDREYLTFTDLVIDILENSNITIDNKVYTIQEVYRTFDEAYLKQLDKDIKKEVVDVKYEKSPLSINKTKMLGLIRLGFFEEFGEAKKLEAVYTAVSGKYKANNKTFAGKQKKYLDLIEYENSLKNEPLSILEQCEYELYYTGRVTVKNEQIPAKYGFITEIDKVGKTRTSATLYSINKGVSTPIKVGSSIYRNVKFQEGDLIEVIDVKAVAKSVNQGGVWVKSATEKELWLKQYRMIRKTKVDMKK